MTRWIIVMAFLFVTQISWATIVGGEYFFNTDPGKGNGVQIIVDSPTDELELNLDISIGQSLPLGINYLYVRFLDDLGQWSHTNKRAFYKNQLTESLRELQALEYFIDADVLEGEGIPLDIPEDVSEAEVNFTANLNNLESGIHFLYVRGQNVLGEWGLAIKRPFYLEEDIVVNIEKLEYYYVTTDFVSTRYTFNLTDPQANVNEEFEPVTTELILDTEYTIYVRPIDENGVRGNWGTSTFVFGDVTSVLNLQELSFVRIKTNPVKNNLCLEFDKVMNKLQYIIYNNTGGIVLEGVIISDEIGVSSLPAGIYFIAISDKNELITKERFVKE